MESERIYERCFDCGCNTFLVYKIKGEDGSYQQCTNCGSQDCGVNKNG